MQLSRLAVIFLSVSAVLSSYSQEKPASKTDPASADSAPAQARSATSTASQPVVDAVKVTGSTFESPYFKFTYELPQGWKTLDDASRTAANQQALQEDIERSKMMGTPKKASAKTPAKTSAPAAAKSAETTGQHPHLATERYNLMAASPNGLDSLASPVLPRINIWAHRRVPPLDKPEDHAQLLISGKHNDVLVRPQKLDIEGHSFVRVELANANGNYQARYITVMGDYLIGFDFLTTSEKEMVEIANSIKSVRFE